MDNIIDNNLGAPGSCDAQGRPWYPKVEDIKLGCKVNIVTSTRDNILRVCDRKSYFRIGVTGCDCANDVELEFKSINGRPMGCQGGWGDSADSASPKAGWGQTTNVIEGCLGTYTILCDGLLFTPKYGGVPHNKIDVLKFKLEAKCQEDVHVCIVVVPGSKCECCKLFDNSSTIK